MVKLDNLKTVTMTDSFENESTTVKHPSAALDTDVQVPTGLKQPDLDGNARDLAYEELKKTQKGNATEFRQISTIFGNI